MPEGARSPTISCLFPDAVNHGWLVSLNGTLLDDDSLRAHGITRSTELTTKSSRSNTMTIDSIPKNNGLQVQCFATVPNETIHYSENTTFVVLGTLIIL